MDKWLSPMLGPGSWWHRAHRLRAVPCDDNRTGSYHDPNGASGPGPESCTFVLHDLAQPPTAEQVSQGGLAPYVDGVYGSAAFAANPVADFVDGDTSDGITPTLTDRRLYGAGIDSLLAREDAAGVVDFALRDLIGSVRAWVEADGTIAARYDFDSYGNKLNGPSLSGGGRFGFTGRPRGGQGAHDFFRARFYDTEVGRFLSADMLRVRGREPNPFAYVQNSPLNRIDSRGLCDQDPSPQQEDRESFWRTWGEKIFGWIADILGMRYAGRTAVPPAMTEAAGALEAAAGVIEIAKLQAFRGRVLECPHLGTRHRALLDLVREYVNRLSQEGRPGGVTVGPKYDVCRAMKEIEDLLRKGKAKQCKSLKALQEKLAQEDFRRLWEAIKARACGRRIGGNKR